MHLRSGTVYRFDTPWPTPNDVQPTFFIDVKSFLEYYNTLLRKKKSTHLNQNRLIFLEIIENVLFNECIFVGQSSLVGMLIKKLKDANITTFNKDEYIQSLLNI